MACSKLSASSCFPVLPEDAFHPDSSFRFPKRAFGKTNPKMRACQAEYFPDDCQAHYRQSYFETLDLVVNAIEDRFDQPDFSWYRKLKKLLMHTIHGESTQKSSTL